VAHCIVSGNQSAEHVRRHIVSVTGAVGRKPLPSQLVGAGRRCDTKLAGRRHSKVQMPDQDTKCGGRSLRLQCFIVPVPLRMVGRPVLTAHASYIMLCRSHNIHIDGIKNGFVSVTAGNPFLFGLGTATVVCAPTLLPSLEAPWLPPEAHPATITRQAQAWEHCKGAVP
jgi:hypothetical protein